MAKKTFEQALAALEEITHGLEEGELNLEESLKKFEEGISLVEYCNKVLDDAQKRVEILLKKGGKITPVPFTEDEETAP